MSEEIIKQIRNGSRTKVDLLYDERGWREQSMAMGETPVSVSPAYILRVWNLSTSGESRIKEVNLQPSEAMALMKALEGHLDHLDAE